jgi:hypothetical protein
MTSYSVARYRAMLNGRRGPAPPPTKRMLIYTENERALMLLKTVTMDEIADAAGKLGLTFREAYAERARVFKVRFGV